MCTTLRFIETTNLIECFLWGGGGGKGRGRGLENHLLLNDYHQGSMKFVPVSM